MRHLWSGDGITLGISDKLFKIKSVMSNRVLRIDRMRIRRRHVEVINIVPSEIKLTLFIV